MLERFLLLLETRQNLSRTGFPTIAAEFVNHKNKGDLSKDVATHTLKHADHSNLRVQWRWCWDLARVVKLVLCFRLGAT